MFIPSSTFKAKELSSKLKDLRSKGVITVGEQDEFLKQSGMINLLLHKGKVGFEVNVKDAAVAGVKFRSKLLRLAKRVVGNGNQQDKK